MTSELLAIAQAAACALAGAFIGWLLRWAVLSRRANLISSLASGLVLAFLAGPDARTAAGAELAFVLGVAGGLTQVLRAVAELLERASRT